MLQIVVLLGAILALLNVLGYTAVSWWIVKVTKEYFETEDEKVYFFEPLEKEISVEDMQKIVNANEKLVKELKDAKD